MSADTSDLSHIRDEDLLRKMVRDGYSMWVAMFLGAIILENTKGCGQHVH